MSTRHSLMTADEFANTGPETDGFELVRGEMVPMPPAKGAHGAVCVNVGYLLKVYVKARGAGSVIGNDSGIITERDPDTVRGIDVALFLDPPWTGLAPNRWLHEPPDLAVEVRSEGQPWKELLTKADEYIQMGSPMVWIIDPSVKRLTVFQPDSEPLTYAAENELDGGTILPGFRCRIIEFFE